MPIDLYDPEDWPPLYIALTFRNFEQARTLLTQGGCLDDIVGLDGNSLLHGAAQAGDAAMFEFFLAHECPHTLESFDYIAQTPLIRAAAHGQTEAVDRLLSAGANPNAHDESRIGNTALREAVRGGHAEIVAILLRAGADACIPGWMGISAVDQAHYEIAGGLTSATAREIQQLLARFPSALRDKQQTQKRGR